MNLQRTDLGREGKVYCKLCNAEITLYIWDDEVTEEYAERCVEAMNNLPAETIEIICRAAKAYCLECIALTGNDIEEDMTVPITAETPAEEILRCFTPSSISIEKPEDASKIGYQLGCNCDWEIEHGMEIDILDNKVVYLSAFNDYSPWMDYDKDDDWNFVNAI